MDIEKLESWLLTVISGLVSKPDEVKIEKKDDEMGVHFVVTVAEEDRGKVIGKKGNIAEATRTLLRSVGFMADLRASMTIDVPGTTFVLPKEEEV